jgi:hypothetical protein
MMGRFSAGFISMMLRLRQVSVISARFSRYRGHPTVPVLVVPDDTYRAVSLWHPRDQT